MNKKSDILSYLRNPESEYRPLNYWGWLENIEPDEVRWQVEEMWKAGLGGYVMHARGGLQIPYMGKQWQDSVKAMIEQGKKLGMIAVVDDEEGWPSGFGAGKVNGMGEEFWLKWLECEIVSTGDLKTSACTIGIYILRDNTVYRIRDISQGSEADAELIHIYYKSSKYYVDNLDPKVVCEFIKASYDDYYGKYPDEFGKGIKGMFSDEPQIARDHITWSLTLPGEFEKKNGYDLLEVLPAIYLDIDGFEKVRYDFWNLISSLFTESYSKQISEWSGKHNVELFGHICLEEDFINQIKCNGSAMPFYEYMQIPGVDWLYRIPISSMAVKQVTSVSEQLGKRRVLSEMYGCVGWNVSFEELKWIGEWHYLLGINMMLQHLGLYSLKGARKREYPASLFYQQPWWNEFKAFNDYFSRLSRLIAESEPVIDLLVIHPIRSAWVAFNGFNQEKVMFFDKKFKYLTDNLLGLNYDFHYGDEGIISKYGKVRGDKIIVGKISYKAAIIPPSLSLDKDTVELLDKFIHNGGTVISVDEFPCLVAGEPNIHISKLRSQIIQVENAMQQIDDALSGIVDRKLRIVNCEDSLNKDIYCCTRIIQGETIHFILNTNREMSHEVRFVPENNTACLIKLDLLDLTEEDVTIEDSILLEPMQSVLLVNRESDTSNRVSEISGYLVNSTVKTKPMIKKRVILDGEWDLISVDSNSITLDYCQYSIEDGIWQEEMPVILLQEKLLAMGTPIDVSIKFRITIDFKTNSSIYLVIEEPEKFDIFINGRKYDCVHAGWWIDKSFKKLSIESFVEPGENEIVLKRHFCNSFIANKNENDNDKNMHEAEVNRTPIESQMESIYLLGDFSVDIQGHLIDADRRAVFSSNSFKLSEPRKNVYIKNLVAQGYPFFAGRIRLSKKFHIKNLDKANQQVELKFTRPDSIITIVSINGMEVKRFLWAPYSADITGFVREGKNEISVELINSCRNLLGPHHHRDGELYEVEPHSFKNPGKWTDDYCFVRFGIASLTITIKE